MNSSSSRGPITRLSSGSCCCWTAVSLMGAHLSVHRALLLDRLRPASRNAGLRQAGAVLFSLASSRAGQVD